MHLKATLSGLAVGTLMLGGLIVANPFSTSAQDTSTPAAQTEDMGNGTPVVGTPNLNPAIDLQAAQTTALQGQGTAVVTEISLSGEDGVLVYDIQLDNDVEVRIDATTGAVLDTGTVSDGENADDGNGTNDDDNGGDKEEQNDSAGDD